MEKKQLISVVKPLIAAALLFGSSGGVAWGQTQMDCRNAFGAGESRSDGSVPAGTPAVPNRGGAGKITSDADGWLVTDPNNTPNTSIIIGTTSPNVVGEKWIFTGVLPPSQQGSSGGGWIDASYSGYPGYHIGVYATSCSDSRWCGSTHGSVSGSGTSQSESPVYTGCDNTFFRNHGGSYYRPNSNWAGADFTSNLETVVNIGSGTLGGSSVVGTSSTNAFDCDYFYFKNIPYQIKTITITGANVPLSDGCASCQYTTYTKTITHPGGNVNQGRIVVDAGSHIHLRKNIGADGSSGSKAILDLPSGGNQYSLMVDGDIDEAKVKAQGGSGSAINNLASMAPKAVIGVYGNYLPGSSGAMGTDASGGGGTILIGPSTGGQNKMTIVASTQSSSNTYPHGFSSNGNTVYTGTCVPVDGSSNVGNYGTATPHDITIENTMTLPGTMGAGKLQVFNTGGSVDFKNKIPGTGAGGNILLMAKGTFKMNSASTHTITMAAGHTSLMGGVVELDKDETVTLGGAGNYNVFGFDAAGNTPTLGPLSWPTLCGPPSYFWCGNTERAEHIPHAGPNIAYPLQVAITGQAYDGDCMPAFSGGGHIKSKQNSTVKVNNSGSARWQAMGDITTGNNKQLNWEVGASSTGTASWLANGNITLGTGNTTNWKSATSSTDDRLFWNAKNITTNNLTATWETSDGNMYWRAIQTLQAGSSGTPLGTVTWKSTGKGNMLWEATTLNVVGGTVTFQQTGTTGHTNWHAIGDINVKAGSGVTFTNESTGPNGEGTMTWLAGGNINTSAAGELIKFEQKTSATAGRNAWKAGHDIHTNSKITFNNETSKYNMEWHACNDILTNYNGSIADGSDNFLVTFLNKKEGNVIWHANHDIITRSKTDFESTSTASGNITWYAGNDIHTYLGKLHPSTLTNGVNFKQEGAGRTIWQAGNDLITHNAVHFQFTSNAKDWASLGLLAGRNITLGGVNASEYDVNNTSVTNEFKVETEVNDTVVLHAKDGYILTNSLVNLERSNTGAALTKLWAGCGTFKLDNDIDVEHTFNYTEPTGGQAAGSQIYLYAENDIFSNKDAASGSCDTREAPITFTVPAGSKTITKWEAERNINTMGRVDFAYGNASSAGPLTWLSRAGYIQTERPVTIAYKSDSTISILAEDWRHDPASHNDVKSHANATGRRGNIHFFDSVRINRNNTAAGMTQLKAENHIWTAMLDYVDEASTGDTMEIISHKGDIYLGYNDNTPTQTPYQYVAKMNNGYIMQQRPSASCIHPLANNVSYDKNRFIYTIPSTNTKGHLWIKAGWEEKTDRNSVPDDGSRLAGGNIYFSHIAVNQPTGSDHPTVISIPFSGLWRCGNEGDSILHNRSGRALQYYENAGIISGVP